MKKPKGKKMHKFLFRFNNIADMNTAFAASNYVTVELVDEEQQEIDVWIPGTLNGKPVTTFERFDFLASTVKGLALPYTVTRQIEYNWAGLSGAVGYDFVVDNVTSWKRDQENWISFAVNGQMFDVRDDGGVRINPEADVTIHDFNGNGWPIVNIRAVYDDQGNQTTAPSVIPGVFVVMTLTGDKFDADVRAGEDDTIFEKSILGNSFKTQGTKKTYARTDAQTDWGTGYTLDYYERTIGGAKVALVDVATLPDEIKKQHGILRGT